MCLALTRPIYFLSLLGHSSVRHCVIQFGMRVDILEYLMGNAAETPSAFTRTLTTQSPSCARPGPVSAQSGAAVLC